MSSVQYRGLRGQSKLANPSFTDPAFEPHINFGFAEGDNDDDEFRNMERDIASLEVFHQNSSRHQGIAEMGGAK